MTFDNNNAEKKAYITLYRSNPEYKSVLYGNISIPVELLRQIIESGGLQTRQDGTEWLSLDLTLFEADPERYQGKTAPMLTGSGTKQRPRKERAQPISGARF